MEQFLMADAAPKLTEAEWETLWRIQDHGPMRFTAAADLAACKVLDAAGYVEDWGAGQVRITPKGELHIRRHSEPF